MTPSEVGEFDRQFSSLRRPVGGKRGGGGRSGTSKYHTLHGSARARAASAHNQYDRRSVHSGIHSADADSLISPTSGKSLREKILDGFRSFSADRAKSVHELRSSGSVRSHTSTPYTDGTSMSELSGISSASAKTYVTEESSLVLECVENGVKKHYTIPYEVAKRGRLRKKGTKLHIYMDHIFVAKRIRPGTYCKACNITIPFRLGKQGYVCRDCSVTVHKPCHVKVTSHCARTSLPAMELYFYDPSG